MQRTRVLETNAADLFRPTPMGDLRRSYPDVAPDVRIVRFKEERL
jgi:hypothetical protein